MAIGRYNRYHITILVIIRKSIYRFKIGFAEVMTKMVLYYFHERIWFNIGMPDSRKRHIIKTVTWRIVGTLDTIFLSWLISGNPITGLKIGMAEVVTKMAFCIIFMKGHGIKSTLAYQKTQTKTWKKI